jgi:outer membrane protein assembly factor BamE
MQKLIRTLGFAMLALSLASCRLVYTPDVRQGNLFDKTIDQKTADQLKPGLTKRQVLLLLGTPSVATPFNQDRWDYVTTYAHRGGPMTTNTMSAFFNNDTLVRTEGTLFAQSQQQLLKDNSKYKTGYPVNETQGDKSTSSDKPSVGVDATNSPNVPDPGASSGSQH